MIRAAVNGAAEIADALTAFRAGLLTEDELRPTRLRWGVYAQRQTDAYVIRLRGTGGTFSAEQIEAVAGVAGRFEPATVHLTTRQAFQIYGVPMTAVPDALATLEAAGLSSRDTSCPCVRSITTCPLAGICPEEVVDVGPLARALTERFVGRLSEPLPRKVKIAISGCQTDCAWSAIHDVGLVAVAQDEGGRARPGFRILAGGGLGTSPRVAQSVSDFTALDQTIPVVQGVVQAFGRLGRGTPRPRARLKFLIEKIGIESFRRQVGDVARALARDPALKGGPQGGSRKRVTNVTLQKQAGFSAVSIRIPCGDVTPGQLLSVARLAREAGRGEVRLTPRQNLLIPWIAERVLPRVYDDLAAAGLAATGAESLIDVTVCPGAETCRGAVTSGKPLARALETELAEVAGLKAPPIRAADHDDIARLWIAVSGCPNSCSRHQVADVGLHGAAVRVEGRWVPHYQILIGNSVSRPPVFGTPLVRIPARRTPQAIAFLLGEYRRRRLPGEPLRAFVLRAGEGLVRVMEQRFAVLPSYETDPAAYRDLGSDEPFLPGAATGPPEC